MTDSTATARWAALVVAMVAAASLLLQAYLSMGTQGSVSAAFAFLSQFFTILTNLLVCLTMAVAAAGRRTPPVWIGALVVAIAGVGIVYHLVLAKLWNPQGLQWVADQGLHTAVPVLTSLWWLGFADKTRARWRDALIAILWPLVYCVYALTRAEFSGFYPYPFLDLTKLSLGELATNIAALTAGFIVLGLVLVLLARLMRRTG